VATAAMSVMLSMTSGAAAGLMSSRISFHDKKPRVVWCLVSVPQRLIRAEHLAEWGSLIAACEAKSGWCRVHQSCRLSQMLSSNINALEKCHIQLMVRIISTCPHI
jgi:hypothetical protein